MPHPLPLLLSVLLTASLLTGCSNDAETETETETTAGTNDEAALFWLLAETPTDAIGVAEAKQSAQVGDAVTVRGRIGGRHEPITLESGLFILVDNALPTCADNPGDNCRTPWDYCCEPGDVLAANAATVRLRSDDDHTVLLREGELEPMQEVVVVGTVAPGSTPESLIIFATRIATP